MESSQNFRMEGKVDVDETYVGGRDDQEIGGNEGKKKTMSLQWSVKEKAFLVCLGVLLRPQIRKT